MKLKSKTLREFTKDKLVQDCKVCALPDAILKQIRDRNKKICPLPTVAAWLKSEHGINVTADDILRHQRGGHKPGSTRPHG